MASRVAVADVSELIAQAKVQRIPVIALLPAAGERVKGRVVLFDETTLVLETAREQFVIPRSEIGLLVVPKKSNGDGP